MFQQRLRECASMLRSYVQYIGSFVVIYGGNKHARICVTKRCEFQFSYIYTKLFKPSLTKYNPFICTKYTEVGKLQLLGQAASHPATGSCRRPCLLGLQYPDTVKIAVYPPTNAHNGCIYWLQEYARYEHQICNTVQIWYEYSSACHKPCRCAFNLVRRCRKTCGR